MEITLPQLNAKADQEEDNSEPISYQKLFDKKTYGEFENKYDSSEFSCMIALTLENEVIHEPSEMSVLGQGTNDRME